MSIWISWGITLVLGLAIARIVWIEIKCGRRHKSVLSSTNEQINSIKMSVTERYREKFGRDPTGSFETVDMAKAASNKR